MGFHNKKITKSFDYVFSVPKNGLYAISITARCQSSEQTQKRGGEDLRVEIDGRRFREVPAFSKPQYQNVAVSWNGTNLKGAKQTIVFILYLKSGGHEIIFIPRESAVIENEPYITFINDPANIEFNLEEQAEDGDRKPWFAFAFIDLPLQSFSIDASVKWHFRDSDDIKLIVDGEIRKNTWSIFHRNWLWDGSVFRKLFSIEREEKSFQENLPKVIHYIELWADKTPILHSARFNIGQIDFQTKAKVIWDFTILREVPNISAKVLIEKISRNEEMVILEKAIQGERPKNEQGVLLPTNRWHKVKYQNQAGYIYSMAIEIEGEDQNTIQQTIIKEAKAVSINPEILLALADCESRFFPYTVSWNEKAPEVAFGVMQLTEDLIKDLNNESKQFYSPIVDVFDSQQNIRGGVMYFNYLYNIVYKDVQDRLRKAVAAYNTGPGNVVADQPFNLEEYSGETKRIVSCVEGHLKNKTFQKILSGAKTTALVILIFTASLFIYEEFAAPALGMLSADYSPAVMQTSFDNSNNVVHSDVRNMQEPMKFPAVILDEKRKQLSFFSHRGDLVKQTPVERLNLDHILNPPPQFAELNTIHIGSNVLEFPDNTFYFLAATSYGCGANNCNWLLYRFNADQDNVVLISKDIFGWASFYLSPNATKLAVVRGVHGGACVMGDYLSVIDLVNFRKEEIELMSHEDYQTNLIELLAWHDNQEILVKTLQYDCDTGKSPHYESKIIKVE